MCAGQFGDPVRDVHHGVGVKQGRHVLAHARQTLKAHAGIDVLLHKLGVVALAVVIELREHDVPDFDIPVTVAAHGAAGLAAAPLRAAVVVDLRARTARACAMLPEVVLLAKAEDALSRDTDLLVPDFKRLVVVEVDRRVQPIRLQTDPFRAGEELPCPGQRLFLKVIAEREVAQHLKIGAVARGLADVVDIARADALLAGADARARRHLLAGKERLHRRHAGVDEQNRFVVLRNQRKAGQAQMSLALKKAQVHLAQFVQAICLVCHVVFSFYLHMFFKKISPPRYRGELARGTTLIAQTRILAIR